jgi:hypothetical protein
LNTDNTHTKAAVTIATPAAEMPDIMLITLCDLRENKYRRAMCHAKENLVLLLIDLESKITQKFRITKKYLVINERPTKYFLKTLHNTKKVFTFVPCFDGNVN